MPADPNEIARIARALRENTITVVLGAGASLDPNNDLHKDWTPDTPGMPGGAQLGAWLARKFEVQNSDRLSLTAQYAATFGGTQPVRQALNDIFSRTQNPLLVHDFCAGFANWRSERRKENPRLLFPLFVTTNYDDLLEKAFRNAKIEFDLLTYDTSPPSDKATLFHTEFRDSAGGISERKEIRNNITYDAVDTELRACIIKIHGSACSAVRRAGEQTPSFVITEDDYIRYLASVRWDEFFPAPIGEHFGACHYLFLGHSLLDWNLRVMLHQIMGKRWKAPTDYKIWAVRKTVDGFESEWSSENKIKMVEEDLSVFIPELDRKVRGLTQAA